MPAGSDIRPLVAWDYDDDSSEDNNEGHGNLQAPAKKVRQDAMTLIDLNTSSFTAENPSLEQIVQNQIKIARALNSLITYWSTSDIGTCGTSDKASDRSYTDKYVKETTIHELKAKFDGLIATDGVEALWYFNKQERTSFLADTVFPRFAISLKGGKVYGNDTHLMQVLDSPLTVRTCILVCPRLFNISLQKVAVICNTFVRNKKCEIKNKVISLVVNVRDLQAKIKQGCFDEWGKPVEESEVKSSTPLLLVTVVSYLLLCLAYKYFLYD